MYEKPQPSVERGRITKGHPLAKRVHPYLLSDASFGNNGAFVLEYPATHTRLQLIVSDGDGWEHVSVSIWGILERPKEQQRCPRWEEMAWVKDQFWYPEEAVMQLHPPHSTYVNNHPYVLHLWKPLRATIPLPDSLMVGIQGLEYNAATRRVEEVARK